MTVVIQMNVERLYQWNIHLYSPFHFDVILPSFKLSTVPSYNQK